MEEVWNEANRTHNQRSTEEDYVNKTRTDSRPRSSPSSGSPEHKNAGREAFRDRSKGADRK